VPRLEREIEGPDGALAQRVVERLYAMEPETTAVAAHNGDELGLRWFAQAAAGLAPALLIPINEKRLVRDRREALDAALNLAAARPSSPPTLPCASGSPRHPSTRCGLRSHGSVAGCLHFCASTRRMWMPSLN
jgi:hypothetical protein